MNKELQVAVTPSHWFDDNNPFESFKFIKECGFDSIDFAICAKYPYADLKVGKRSEFFSKDIEEILEYYRPIKEALDKNGIVLCQSHAIFPPYTPDEEFMVHLYDVIEKNFAVCNYLGCSNMVVHPWSNYDKEVERKANLEYYTSLIPMAKKYGVKVCLENMFFKNAGTNLGGCCSSAKEAVWYIDTLNEIAGEEIFGYCFDLGHANLCRRNFFEEIKTLGHRLTVLHLHDNNAVDDQHLAPMTQRMTDWNGFIQGLCEINYRGSVSFESGHSLADIPKDLYPSMLRYTADVGKYIRKRILEYEH